MNLDNIRVEIRPRSPFEAIDLGFVMARQWFMPLWLMWIAIALPFSLLAHLILFKHLIIAGILIWWLKPVYEKPLVFWLSRALFNERSGYKDIVRQYFKIIKPRLFADLTYLRFTPNRSFMMPVAILENLKGKEYSIRTKVLGRNQSAGIGLTFICIVFDVILNFSMLVIIFFILPEELRWISFGDFIYSKGTIATVLGSFVSILAMSIIAPFYVAAGFCLYINRRTELEAWDIEISFKRLMARKAEKRKTEARRIRAINKAANKTISMTLGLIFLITSSFIIFSNSVHADSNISISKKEASLVINKVLEHDDFGKRKTETAWKLKEFDKIDFDFDLPQWLKNFLESFGETFKWTRKIPEFAGILLEILAWILGGLIVIFILYKIGQNKQWFQYYRARPKKQPEAPSKLFGLDVSERSLPDDIINKVREFLKNNEIREALSLLYRGALVKLINDFNIQIPASATESECISLVKSKREKREISFFQTLTLIWLAMAYGHITPEKQTIEEVCQNWQIIYGK
ncbi:MAG: hypothetical protein K8R67_04875 [Desulfobacteraceae bacterium]|nr:hypothetical protein [Desulfobacteraceae bacterium]